jgi:hypothetical protein
MALTAAVAFAARLLAVQRRHRRRKWLGGALTANGGDAASGQRRCCGVALAAAALAAHWLLTAAMLQAAVVLITLAFALLFYIKYQNATRDWGDTITGFRCGRTPTRHGAASPTVHASGAHGGAARPSGLLELNV